jgi:hypothetical protein
LSVNVPVLEFPPTTVLGDSDRLVRVAGRSVSTADLEFDPIDAAIVMASDLPTPFVPTVKLAELAPDGIVTDVGTLASAPLDERFTVTPDVPAACEIVTVPELEFPP